MDQQANQQAKGVGDDMTLASFDLLSVRHDAHNRLE
jgi:hypothetical protein